MNKSSRFAGFELVHLLLLVTSAELAFNRLATRELRPHGEVAPPWWHQWLDHVGLYFQYFASTLALGVVAYELWRLVRDSLRARAAGPRPLHRRVSHWGLVAAGVPFLGLCLASLATPPGAMLSFWLEAALIAMLVFLALGQLGRGGDLGAKIGLVVAMTPIFIHFYGAFAFQVLADEDARWSDRFEHIQLYGQWTAVVAALVSPYCFAPRPFFAAAARLGPLVVASFVSLLGTVILHQHYEVGMRIAYHGLGIDLGPGAPGRFLAVYLVALGTITWTLTACFTAESVARRDIGVGLGLIVVGGYGFTWPLQYLVTLVGLMTIAGSLRRVAHEEKLAGQDRDDREGFRAPPITDAVWQSYVREVAAALDASSDRAPRSADDAAASESEAPAASHTAPRAAVVTVRGDARIVTTHIAATRHGVDIALCVMTDHDAITTIEITCGSVPESGEPAWTMYARPEKILGIGAHPEPPATSAPVRKIDDNPFEQRFRVRDADRVTETLFDEVLRARAIALIDGWVAFWPERGLRYRVLPGNGAPLDHPIPITELAFRGAGVVPSVTRLVALIDLLAAMASRALAARASG